jgi:hypothetical protein
LSDDEDDDHDHLDDAEFFGAVGANGADLGEEDGSDTDDDF